MSLQGSFKCSGWLNISNFMRQRIPDRMSSMGKCRFCWDLSWSKEAYLQEHSLTVTPLCHYLCILFWPRNRFVELISLSVSVSCACGESCSVAPTCESDGRWSVLTVWTDSCRSIASMVFSSLGYAEVLICASLMFCSWLFCMEVQVTLSLPLIRWWKPVVCSTLSSQVLPLCTAHRSSFPWQRSTQ